MKTKWNFYYKEGKFCTFLKFFQFIRNLAAKEIEQCDNY